ncbi:MAG TPA: signal recognition particle-docking protein FtsY [Mycobacteriales bacterium]|nr:signal recognition particle-docking protein FtsY [Mycobacteriales bacterium]
MTFVAATALVTTKVRRRPPLPPPRSGGTTATPRPVAPPRPVEKPRSDAQGVRDLMRPAAPAPAPSPTLAQVPVEIAPLPVEVPDVEVPDVEVPDVEVPEPTATRMVRLRSRLARSQSSLGRGLLGALSRDTLDEEAWEDVETALLSSDIGVGPTMEVVESLRTRVKVMGTRSPDALRELLREELVGAIGDLDRSLRTLPSGDKPAVVLVVGVNGTGKTTTCGKLARVLVADGRSVVLGAADTFRAAAANQLATWAGRVGAEVVRGPEGGDPAAVAFDAVRVAQEKRSDTVLIDTAGRLHTKTGLMDELAKIKRVAERLGAIDEILLVLDATTGQNGIVQAKQFAAAVGVTGVVLTKMDGTAKGGIVVAVQRELGIPVKLIGLGEGPDDLAPFVPELFVDALLADDVG